MLSVVWLLLVIIMAASAIVDLMTYRIPNVVTVVLTALFLVTALLHMAEVEWLSHIGALLLVLGAGVVLFACRQMGAGDVKLLAALALWAGVYALPSLLLWVSLSGFTAMVAILILRRILCCLESHQTIGKRRALPRVLRKGMGIPYAIGIAPGAILASFSFPNWLWQQ